MLAFYWLDFLLWGGRRFFARPTPVVVYERYFLDVLVDPARYRLREHRVMAGLLARALPQPTVCVILTGSPEAIARRKGELTTDEVRSQHARLDSVGRRLRPENVLFLDSTESTVDDVVDRIAERVIKLRSQLK